MWVRVVKTESSTEEEDSIDVDGGLISMKVETSRRSSGKVYGKECTNCKTTSCVTGGLAMGLIGRIRCAIHVVQDIREPSTPTRRTKGPGEHRNSRLRTRCRGGKPGQTPKDLPDDRKLKDLSVKVAEILSRAMFHDKRWHEEKLIPMVAKMLKRFDSRIRAWSYGENPYPNSRNALPCVGVELY